MHRSTTRRTARASSLALRLVVVAFPFVLGASLSGCCDTWEGDLCGVMDPDVTECPSREEFANASGGEVTGGPDKKYYLDMRSDADPYSGGLLCCYRVKHTSCGDSIKLY